MKKKTGLQQEKSKHVEIWEVSDVLGRLLFKKDDVSSTCRPVNS